MFEIPLAVGPDKLAGLRIQPTIGADAAALIDILIRTRKPQRILEIGTSFGYAACAMGLAAKECGGHVTSIEIQAELAEAARQNVAALNLADTVTILTGNALEIVPTLKEKFGLILQDGGKMEYLPLLEPLVSLLEPRGLLITDDILFPVMDIPASARHWQVAMADYNTALASHREFDTAFLPIGDGVAVSIKKV